MHVVETSSCTYLTLATGHACRPIALQPPLAQAPHTHGATSAPAAGGTTLAHTHTHSNCGYAAAHSRPFACGLCGLAFARNSDLRRHVRLHATLRQFQCRACGKDSNHSDALTRHMSPPSHRRLLPLLPPSPPASFAAPNPLPKAKTTTTTLPPVSQLVRAAEYGMRFRAYMRRARR